MEETSTDNKDTKNKDVNEPFRFGSVSKTTSSPFDSTNSFKGFENLPSSSKTKPKPTFNFALNYQKENQNLFGQTKPIAKFYAPQEIETHEDTRKTTNTS
jgi:hypothetical protein